MGGTYRVADFTKHHPWRYPGSAGVEGGDPCGISGGWYTKGAPGNGGEAPPGAPQGELGSTSKIFPQLLDRPSSPQSQEALEKLTGSVVGCARARESIAPMKSSRKSFSTSASLTKSSFQPICLKEITLWASDGNRNRHLKSGSLAAMSLSRRVVQQRNRSL